MSNLEAHPGQSNPNLPAGDTVGLRAFNLMRGAAFMLIDQPDPRVWVVQNMDRDVNTERVYLWCRDATNLQDQDGSYSFHLALNLDFCTLVALVGIVANPDDDDDNDWGVN